MPTVTGQSMVTQALTDLGILSPGEGIDASNLQNGFNHLNILLDSLAGSKDFVYAVKTTRYALTAVASLLIGPGGTTPFNVARPIKIENAQCVLAVGADSIEHDIEIVSQPEFQTIDDKAATGNLITKMYCEMTVPDARLYLWPIPKCSVTTSLELGTWQTISAFPDLSTDVELPPTYWRAINLGLQVELATTYGSLISPAKMQEIMAQKAEAMLLLRNLNSSISQTATPSIGPMLQAAQQMGQK